MHLVTFTLVSNLATDYIQKRRREPGLFSFDNKIDIKFLPLHGPDIKICTQYLSFHFLSTSRPLHCQFSTILLLIEGIPTLTNQIGYRSYYFFIALLFAHKTARRYGKSEKFMQKEDSVQVILQQPWKSLRCVLICCIMP